uniref:Reverse transcriptase domain-containing protein n=1 Tax=Clytia hemisphaerica TaxID=252671 RepID=A0A7M5X5M8_9CNID
MEVMGVIRKVDKPTAWCHPMVAVKKPTIPGQPGQPERLRICIDLTQLNKTTKREFYQLPSCDETLAQIGDNGKVFSKLDANSGYWQMPLSEESQLKATFTTPFGRYCPTRAPFGLTSMPEIFSKKMDEVVEGLEGVIKSMDDF